MKRSHTSRPTGCVDFRYLLDGHQLSPGIMIQGTVSYTGRVSSMKFSSIRAGSCECQLQLHATNRTSWPYTALREGLPLREGAASQSRHIEGRAVRGRSTSWCKAALRLEWLDAYRARWTARAATMIQINLNARRESKLQ